MVYHNNEILKFIKETVNELLPGNKILLFGSRARDDFKSDSDFDFMIITRKKYTPENKRDYRAQLRKKFAKYKIATDTIIQSEEEINVKNDIPGHIVMEAVLEGKAI